MVGGGNNEVGVVEELLCTEFYSDRETGGVVEVEWEECVVDLE